jgi:hypothetical protein
MANVFAMGAADYVLGRRCRRRLARQTSPAAITCDGCVMQEMAEFCRCDGVMARIRFALFSVSPGCAGPRAHEPALRSSRRSFLQVPWAGWNGRSLSEFSHVGQPGYCKWDSRPLSQLSSFGGRVCAVFGLKQRSLGVRARLGMRDILGFGRAGRGARLKGD